ncbi:VCBS repeat-containing protein [Catalinimonas niigatensis]|uniref:VCBS repeat-containing protein n=1 Tax=Catalinimonas niigatensis TaxID=1397264 RepID=UPI00266683A5|nr:VCBS repeat-containing protein [Catalinimonas niigatensis]WPP50710.1 VCBS repeat-containing protein [Catalinimonas niigatensis]
MTLQILSFSIITLVFGTFSCQSDHAKEKDILFTKLSSQDTGVNFINLNEENEIQNIIANDYFYNGGGVALGDINNDGLVDIYLSANQGQNKLYLNRGIVEGRLQFEDITEQVGVSAANGWRTGVAMVDINGDGFLDIYVCRSAEDQPMFRENSLYINNGDLTFTDQAYAYGLNDDSYSTQAAFFDYDQDGDLDMFLLNHSRQQISNAYDISRRNSQQRVPYVGNKLYRNDPSSREERGGVKGVFTDISDSLGIYGPAANYGLGVALADINNDGWIDIYASNDYTGKDKFYLNREGQVFEEKSDVLLTHMSQFSMGVDIADVNNDGWMDIFSLDMLPEDNQRQKELHWPDKYDLYQAMVKNGLHHQYMRNMLHLNRGIGEDSLPLFSEIGQLAGVSNTDWSWAALLADYDNDGLQDLFISNGFKRAFTNNYFLAYQADLLSQKKEGKPIDQMQEILSKMPSNAVHNYMYRNTNGLFFSDQSAVWGFGEPTLTNGAAYADLDNDGDLDLVLNHLDAEAGIYRNNTDSSTHRFLKIHLKGKAGNIFGLGAKVQLYSGDSSLVRVQNPYRGFQSSMEPTLFFGLGEVKTIDSLMISWPTGEIQTLKQIRTNQTLTLDQTEAGLQKTANQKPEKALFVKSKSQINFKHEENAFIDFKLQSLLPRMYSSAGPALAGADVNGDGLMDIFIGGARGQSGSIFLQDTQQKYTESTASIFPRHAMSEDVDALFFDMDNDGDHDLYVVSGGYEYSENDDLLQDHLYRNLGNGNFEEVSLPVMLSSSSCVQAEDIDGDGDLDLFVGGRIIPGRYPETPQSYILLNDGQGNFSIATDQIVPELSEVGMVTDALWMDVNQDQQADLIVVGEWMPVKVFINRNGKLEDESSTYFAENTEGWWHSLLAADFDQDGDLDLVIGNFGMNNQFQATSNRPVSLYYGDYDQNGAIDPIMNYYIGDQSYPSPTRDELIAQSPMFKKRFPDYASYAQARIADLLTPEEIKASRLLKAYQFETTYFENREGTFVPKKLPTDIQFAPVFALAALDVNQDGHLDIVSGGNLDKMRARFGKASGNFGTVLLGDGKGDFKPLNATHSGIQIKGEVRKILQDKDQLIFGRNDDTPQIYQFSNPAF